MAGDNQSTAFAVNSSGQVVGQSTDGTTLRAFYWDGSPHNVTTAGMSAVAYAISNGSTVYAAGYQQAAGSVRQAVRWTPTSSNTPTLLETVDSYALGINDAGTAVGRYFDANSAVHGAIWPLGGARIDIPPLPGGTHTAAQDINNDGIVIGITFGATSEVDRAWVRLTDGELIQLPGLAGSIGTQALALSDVVNGQFYVVGVNYNQAAVRQGIRWTFQLGTKTTTQEPSGEMSQATGVTNLGAVSGISISAPTSRAVLWRNGITLLLGPTGSNSGARGIATSTAGSVYVTGDVFSGGSPAATRWTVP
ncbi:MAG TPA: hypothetical protein VM166_11150 [Gemmatimonadaceae bacterium]|nr:hypothetical protein [Gemmatimonadaceae bacterium]